MGVVNVTPDSFSDGGLWFEPDAAIAHGRELLEQGADIVDVGGESTRPGAERPDEDEELRRVLPVVRALAADGARVSIDTMRAGVAREALEAGATMVNDVSGGLADRGMPSVAADTGVPFVVMHWRGHSADMQSRARYEDVVADVCGELSERVETLLGQGLRREQLLLDPGLGFAKKSGHNWSLLRHLDQLQGLGLPVLVGASRKTFLGRLTPLADGSPRPAADRDAATVATSVVAAQAGVWGIRVHNVRDTVDALRVVRALEEAP
ncbi:MAG TPA: dihydropteroate synthase [Segeticoccus sp.]|nr:dihydropteroate synthase [Segeticoccus sp.]